MPPATILETQSPPPDHSYCRTFATAAFQSASLAPHALSFTMPHIIAAHCRSSETKALFSSHLQCIEMASALSDFGRSKKRNRLRDLLSALFAADSKQGFGAKCVVLRFAISLCGCLFCSECFANTLSMPDLVPHLRVLVGTMNAKTRLMTEVEFDAKSE